MHTITHRSKTPSKTLSLARATVALSLIAHSFASLAAACATANGAGADVRPVAIDARFSPSSHAWSARDVITAVETARAKLIKPVPFYIYDAPILPTSIEAELDAMKACGAAAKNYHYGGEYWFLKQLQNHRWRVSNPDDAQLLVVPSLANFQAARGRAGGIRLMYCKGLTPIEKIAAALSKTPTFRARLKDHVYVGLDWEKACLPGFPSELNSTKTSCMHGAGGHPKMLRAFIESHWSDPLLHSIYKPQPQPTNDWLIPAPYVDNGQPHALDVLEERWAAEHAQAALGSGRRTARRGAAAT